MSNENDKNKRKAPEKSSAVLPKPREEKRPRGFCPTFWFRVKDTDLRYPLQEDSIPRGSLLYVITHTSFSVSVDSDDVKTLQLPDGISADPRTESICRRIFEVLDGRNTVGTFPFSVDCARISRSVCEFWMLPEISRNLPDPFPTVGAHYKFDLSKILVGKDYTEGSNKTTVSGVFLTPRTALVLLQNCVYRDHGWQNISRSSRRRYHVTEDPEAKAVRTTIYLPGMTVVLKKERNHPRVYASKDSEENGTTFCEVFLPSDDLIDNLETGVVTI